MRKAKNKITKITILTDELKNKKTVLGSKVTLKKIREKEVEKIYFSNDCPENNPVLDEIMKKAKANKVEIINLELTKEELKEICQKQFNISTISILKEKTVKKAKEMTALKTNVSKKAKETKVKTKIKEKKKQVKKSKKKVK